MSAADTMPESSVGPGGAPSLSASEYPLKAVDFVDSVVGKVNDKVVRPLTIGARAIVFGLLVATMATIALLLLAIMAVRFFDVYLFGFRVWASDAIVGGLLCVGGLALWLRRRPSGSAASPD